MARFGAATVSDALDRLGIAGQATGITPLQSSVTLVGRAWTVRMVPITGIGGSVGDYLDDVPRGRAVVIDNGGRTDCTVWGDLLSTFARQHGVAGTVIHGVCRDSDNIRAMRYPMFTRGATMRTGKDRVRMCDVNVPVSLGSVSVCPDDLIVGDGDGVVVVPAREVARVLAASEEIHQAEEQVRMHLEEGASLRDARKAVGYHALQRSESAS